MPSQYRSVPLGVGAAITLLLSIGSLGCGHATLANKQQAPPNGSSSVRALTPTPNRRDIRATGTIQALRAFTVQVPQISGQVGTASNNGDLTLVKLVPNGSSVKKDQVLAEFDRTAQLDAAQEAKAKYEDLSHQVREKAAKNNSEAAKDIVTLTNIDVQERNSARGLPINAEQRNMQVTRGRSSR